MKVTLLNTVIAWAIAYVIYRMFFRREGFDSKTTEDIIIGVIIAVVVLVVSYVGFKSIYFT
jgi:hypothetical protein